MGENFIKKCIKKVLKILERKNCDKNKIIIEKKIK